MRKAEKWKSPDPVLCTQMLLSAGLEEQIKDWDQLERDLLFLAAQEITAQEITEHWKSLPKAKVAKLLKLVSAAMKKEGVK
jgi:hypothetical protein